MQLHNFRDAGLLNEALAHQVSTILNDAIRQRGVAYLVVSGGKTPVGLFEILAQTPICWEKVTITLADERCVSLESTSRNERLIRDYLLQHSARNATFISLFDERIDQDEGIKNTAEIMASLPAFDVVILGMGIDGHTASLLPGSKELSDALDDQAAAALIITPENAPCQRISLSKKRLLDSRIIFLHFVGREKRAVFNRALAEHNTLIMPVSAFLNDQKTNVQLMYAPE